MNKEFKKILIIPMCGIGKRFIDAGYKDHKSMLEIELRNMLERVIDKFEKIKVYLITSNSVLKILKRSKRWNEIEARLNFIIIEDHNLGPAYSIFKAYEFLPKGIATFISYCDITWNWVDNNIPSLVNIDAAIFCHYGFHPHLVNNNYSAFCKSLKNNIRLLDEIKEKESFTGDWMNEPLSIGLFYVKDISLIEDSLFKMIEEKNTVSGEYFPSLLFNYVLKSGTKVDLIPVDSFVHYGTPDQLYDLKRWIEIFKNANKFEKNKFLNLFKAFILTSGKGSRMKDISQKPKALLKVINDRMIDMVLKYIPINEKRVSVIYNNLETPISLFPRSTKYHKINHSNSQFQSLLLSENYFRNQENFFLCSCDCFGFFDEKLFSNMISKNIYDIICFGFKPSLLQLKLKSSFSTFVNSDQKVSKIFVKEIPKSNFFGLAGFFWIKNGRQLSEALLKFKEINNYIDRELIIDDVLAYLCSNHIVIGNVPLKQYIHLGTPDEFKEYVYWNSKIKNLLKI